jgi:hypothetical protein
MPVAVPTAGQSCRPSMRELAARAELVQRRRREIKARIATGRKSRSRRALAAVIRDRDSRFALATLLVWKLLDDAYRMTERELRGHLTVAGVRGEYRTFGELTGRQRAALADSVEAMA